MLEIYHGFKYGRTMVMCGRVQCAAIVGLLAALGGCSGSTPGYPSLLICDAGPAQFGAILCSCDQSAIAGSCADVSDATYCAQAADGGQSEANGELLVVCNGTYAPGPCPTENLVGSCYGSPSVITRMYSRNFTTASAESACLEIEHEENGNGGCFVPQSN